jgi:hypothetical protein
MRSLICLKPAVIMQGRLVTMRRGWTAFRLPSS